jgi:hypothetical protein
MFGIVFVAVASGLSLVAVEGIAESASSGARQLRMFGHLLLEPGSPAGTWILIGLVATAALAWSIVFAWSRGHRLERRMAAELGMRRDLPPRRAPGRPSDDPAAAPRAAELPPSPAIPSAPPAQDELASRRARRGAGSVSVLRSRLEQGIDERAERAPKRS